MPSGFLFPHRATLRLQTGTTGELVPILAEPLEVRCLLVRGLRGTEGADEREELVTDTAYCAPETPEHVPTGSRFVIDGEPFVVVTARQWRFPGRPVETVELHLGRASTADLVQPAPPPEHRGYVDAVLEAGAVYYLRLNEPAGSGTVADTVRAAVGVVGEHVTMGAPGVLPALPGDTAASFGGRGVGNAHAVFVGVAPLADVAGQSLEWWCRIAGLPTTANGDFVFVEVRGAALPSMEFGRWQGDGMAYPATFETARHDALCPIPSSGHHHYVITRRTAGRFRMYQDGALIGETAAGVYGMEPFVRIGATEQLPFYGEIGHVAVYPVELTAAQVQSHYALGMREPR